MKGRDEIMSLLLAFDKGYSLKKEGTGIRRLRVGLYWTAKHGNIIENLTSTIDCDLSAILLKNGKFMGNDDLVYYNNLIHKSGTVKHSGDDERGNSKFDRSDTESIILELEEMPKEYDRIILVITIKQAAEKKQCFGKIDNAAVRLVDLDYDGELCVIDLAEDYRESTAIILGEVCREVNGWKYYSKNEGLKVNSINKIADKYI